jgi:hypothetical protein
MELTNGIVIIFLMFLQFLSKVFLKDISIDKVLPFPNINAI